MKYAFLWVAGICVLAFLLQSMPGIPGFTDTFKVSQDVFDGEIWRLVTGIFLHSGIIHLIYNLFALLFFGFVLEKKVGSKNFLIVFFVSGILGNVLGVYFYPSSLGASGAVYGLIGAVTIMEPFMMVWAFNLILPLFLASIIWIMGDVLGIFFPDDVGHYAHLAGIFSGILFGFYFKRLFPSLKKRRRKLRIPDSLAMLWEDRYMR